MDEIPMIAWALALVTYYAFAWLNRRYDDVRYMNDGEDMLDPARMEEEDGK